MTAQLPDVIVVPARSTSPVRVGPLDPDDVNRVRIQLARWLDGQVLAAQLWSADAPIMIGDGVTTKTVGTGTILAPPAPILVETAVVGYVFYDGQPSPATDYTFRVALQAGSRARTIRFVFSFGPR